MAAIKFRRGIRQTLTAHFECREFDCKCGCTPTLHDRALSRKLEQLRRDLGAPLTITSGYRCEKHNKAVGGSSGSRHVTGCAADIKCAAVNPVLLAILARQYFKGVGIYWYGSSAFVHVDTRSIKATWLKSTSSEPYRYTTLKSFILPTIKRGSTGNVNRAATRMLQKLLGITADGTFGINTEKALKAAQSRHGIKVDGICGPETWRHISGAAEYL